MSKEEDARVEILYLNYWEHFKFAAEIGKVLSIDHPKRIQIQKAADNILAEIHKITNQK